MVRFRKAVAVVAIFSMFCLPLWSQTDTGPSTGTKIGRIISDTITTAFPVVKGILDQLFPRSERDKNLSADVVKKAVDNERIKAETRAINAVQPLKELQAQLKIVTDAARHAVVADSELAQIQAIIVVSRSDPSAQPTAAQWTEVSRHWINANSRLDALKAINVNGVQFALREPLQRIADLSFGGVQNTASAVERGDGSAVLVLVGEMRQALGPMSYITGFLVADLTDGLAGIESDIKGAQSTQISNTADFEVALETLRR